MSICVKLNDNGFFTNFNQVVDWLSFGDTHDIQVGVDWHLSDRQRQWDFSYGTPAEGNIWHSFFSPLPCTADPVLLVDRAWTPVLGGFRGYAFYNKPDMRADICRRLHTSFCRHIRLVPDIEWGIEDFARKHFSGQNMIGVHLRNPRGARGIYGHIPPLDAYRRRIDKIVSGLLDSTDWRIFAASDSDGLIEELSTHYPGHVVSQSGITRARKGSSTEIHTSGIPRRSLGVEVISDCWLLSRCTHLIGVQSAVCTAALFINPALQFSNVQTRTRIAVGRIEYGLKKVYCGIFEPVHPQLVQAQALATMQGAA